MDFNCLNDNGYCIVGSPETVRQRLSAYVKEMGFGLLLALLQFGDLPHYRVIKNMELFSTQVMSALREEFRGMQQKWLKAA